MVYNDIIKLLTGKLLYKKEEAGMAKERARIMEKLSKTVIPVELHPEICIAILKVKGY